MIPEVAGSHTELLDIGLKGISSHLKMHPAFSNIFQLFCSWALLIYTTGYFSVVSVLNSGVPGTGNQWQLVVN